MVTESSTYFGVGVSNPLRRSGGLVFFEARPWEIAKFQQPRA
jgi:hypothetical protein